MVVDLVVEAGLPLPVRAAHPLQIHHGAVGEDQPIPGHQHAALAIGHVAAVLADDARALGNEHHVRIEAVIDRLPHLRRDRTRQIAVDASQHDRRDDGAGEQFMVADGRLRRRVEVAIGRLVLLPDQERLVLGLRALGAARHTRGTLKCRQGFLKVGISRALGRCGQSREFAQGVGSRWGCGLGPDAAHHSHVPRAGLGQVCTLVRQYGALQILVALLDQPTAVLLRRRELRRLAAGMQCRAGVVRVVQRYARAACCADGRRCGVAGWIG